MTWCHSPCTGQSKLEPHELDRLEIGNQHTDDLSVISWQCCKAAAVRYGVPDWTSIADSTLTREENIGLMERHATRNGGPSMKEIAWLHR